MIAGAITLVVCCTVVLIAYWMRDVAIRWMDEGAAAERAAQAQLNADATHKLLEAHIAEHQALDERIGSVASRALDAETTAKQALTRLTLGKRT